MIKRIRFFSVLVKENRYIDKPLVYLRKYDLLKNSKESS